MVHLHAFYFVAHGGVILFTVIREGKTGSAEMHERLILNIIIHLLFFRLTGILLATLAGVVVDSSHRVGGVGLLLNRLIDLVIGSIVHKMRI